MGNRVPSIPRRRGFLFEHQTRATCWLKSVSLDIRLSFGQRRTRFPACGTAAPSSLRRRRSRTSRLGRSVRVNPSELCSARAAARRTFAARTARLVYSIPAPICGPAGSCLGARACWVRVSSRHDRGEGYFLRHGHSGRLSRLFGSSPSFCVLRYLRPFRSATITQTDSPCW